MNKIKKILLVKNRAMGDSVIGLSSCKYLKQLFPNSELTYMVPKWIEPLYAKTTFACDKIFGHNLKNIHDYYHLYQYLKRHNFDFIFELFQSGRTGTFFKYYCKFNKTLYFFHNHHRKFSNVIDQGTAKSIIQRDLDGIYSQCINLSNNLNKNLKYCPNYLEYPPQLSVKKQSRKQNIVVIGAIATRQTKQWPLENYLQLAKLIHQKYQSKIIIPISNNHNDKIVYDFFNKSNCKFIELHSVNLEDLPDLLNLSKLYIGNDTGLKHICVALGIKTMTLFGPEQPKEWHPYDKKIHPYFFISDNKMVCRIKNAHYCSLEVCDHLSCLNNISVQRVFDSISF